MCTCFMKIELPWPCTSPVKWYWFQVPFPVLMAQMYEMIISWLQNFCSVCPVVYFVIFLMFHIYFWGLKGSTMQLQGGGGAGELYGFYVWVRNYFFVLCSWTECFFSSIWKAEYLFRKKTYPSLLKLNGCPYNIQEV